MRLLRPSPQDIVTRIQGIVTDPRLATNEDIVELLHCATYLGQNERKSMIAFFAWQACARIAATRRNHENLLQKVLEYRINRTSGYPSAPEREEDDLEALAG
jgi:hypothetical protein